MDNGWIDKYMVQSVDSRRPSLASVLTSWYLVVFLAYIILAAFQKYAIYPLETKILPLYSQYASLIYLPHAVRVLATAIIGPKTFFVLLPAILVESYVFYPVSNGFLTFETITLVIIGAACAPIALLSFKLVGGTLVAGFDASKSAIKWRYVFAGGIMASAINSFGLTAFFFDLGDFQASAIAMLRFFVGDIVGLFVGLVVLTFIFRWLRGARAT